MSHAVRTLPDKARVELQLPGGTLLRPVRESEVTQAYVDGINDPEVARALKAPRVQRQTLEMVRDYVRQNWEDEAAILFGIYIDDGLRGTVRTSNIDFLMRCAVMGIAIFDKLYWGHGWGTLCIRRVAEWSVRTLGIRRIVAGSYASNPGAIRAFEKAGFVHTPELDGSDAFGPYVTCAYVSATSVPTPRRLRRV